MSWKCPRKPFWETACARPPHWAFTGPIWRLGALVSLPYKIGYVTMVTDRIGVCAKAVRPSNTPQGKRSAQTVSQTHPGFSHCSRGDAQVMLPTRTHNTEKDNRRTRAERIEAGGWP